MSSTRSTRPRRTLVQLVASGPGGVRDFADRLQGEWEAAGLDTHLIVLSRDDARERSLAARLGQLVDATGRPCTLLLHFSGYGFQQRGLCFWLMGEIDASRRRLGTDFRLVTMFHELFASGAPWRSAFWLSGAQSWIAASLARTSDGVCTNTTHHAAWLQARTSTGVEVRPVFSTIGEPESVVPASSRERRMVIFGSESTRFRALARLSRHAVALRRAGISQVLEVGSGAAHPFPTAELQHRSVGHLDPAALRLLLGTSAFGLIDYPTRHLGKSTVFAAYAAHGVVTLNTARADGAEDGLAGSRHFVNLNSSPALLLDTRALQSIADESRSWYCRHTLARQAQAFADACGCVAKGAEAVRA